MKSTSLFSLMLLILPLTLLAQQKPIRMEKNFWGIRFYEGETLVRPNQVLKLMESNPAAQAEFKKAMSNYNGSLALSFVGGALIGWPIGTAAAGGQPEWGLAAGGVAVLLLTIPLTSAFTKHTNQAITLYNGGPGSANLRFIPHATGARLIFYF
ncbi:MAG: hypothetical protein JNK10_05685 [Cyclobacteriaceae bacterium]|nr:hypothetical protein [Cyclobacteriaceae bacterium]